MNQNLVAEWSFTSDRAYADPFNDVELDVTFTGEDGVGRNVPAFWAGGDVWSVRFATPVPGRYHYRTVCSDPANLGLHDVQGTFDVEQYRGDNPLLAHGPIRCSPDGRHFQHADGTPFLWLADTWWMGLCSRLAWPQDFQRLALDRLDKGFNVVQIIAGLYPDMPPFYPGGANEAGFPWTEDYSRINRDYFDMADRRIRYLVEIGLTPCIFGCWGYFAKFMGVEKLKKHWRYLVARYGAYPVVWSLAGEGILPYYEDELWGKWDLYTPAARADWTEIGAYVRAIEPFGRLITIHPPNYMDITLGGHNMVEDRSLLDFDMLQTAHGSMNHGWHSVQSIRYAREMTPPMPVLQGEGFYENILEQCREETQRWFFWSSMLSGAAGHSYGANGIWQINTADEPFRGNPIGAHWGDTPWDKAASSPGSAQLGVGKSILEGYEWWLLEPHQEWIEASPANPMISADHADAMQPYAAGIPGKLRIIYAPLHDAYSSLVAVRGMEQGINYNVFYVNPSNGTRHGCGPAQVDSEGRWRPSTPPSTRDWLIVMEAV